MDAAFRPVYDRITTSTPGSAILYDYDGEMFLVALDAMYRSMKGFVCPAFPLQKSADAGFAITDSLIKIKMRGKVIRILEDQYLYVAETDESDTDVVWYRKASSYVYSRQAS